MDDKSEKSGPLGKFYNSIDRWLGLEMPADVKRIYQYPKQGDPSLWIDFLTKEKPFKAWHYSSSLSTDPENIKTIPESNTRSVIHFFPPEAEDAYKREGSSTFWLDDDEFQGKKISVVKRNVAAFTDLLVAIKNGELGQTDYIIGETNYIMANFAQDLGFRRCWEEGYNPPDLNRPMMDEDFDYKVGVSVEDLVEMYDLKNQTPTQESVFAVIKQNRIAKKSATNAPVGI